MQKAIYSIKDAEVKELVDRINQSKVMITFDYQGLTAEEFNALRTLLRKNGCECKVYKNNIARRAAKALNYDDLEQAMSGPKAILFSREDVVAPAKVLYEYAKTNNKIKIAAGVVEKQAVNNIKIIELANLPSYEALLTMLAGGLLSPVRDITIGLHMLVEKLEEAQA